MDAYDQGDTQKLASGYLLTADNQIDTTTGTDKLKAVFDNQDQALFPNQFVNIHLVMEDRPNALVVPSAAIQTGNAGIVCVGGRYRRSQGNVDRQDSAGEGGPGRGTGDHSGQRPASRARTWWWTARTGCAPDRL